MCQACPESEELGGEERDGGPCDSLEGYDVATRECALGIGGEVGAGGDAALAAVRDTAGGAAELPGLGEVGGASASRAGNGVSGHAVTPQFVGGVRTPGERMK